MAFCHLHVHSPWSFLDGASSLERIIERAADTDISALALTDHDTAAGSVRFCRLAEEAGIKPIIGAELTLDGGYHLVILTRNKKGYGNLCRLLTRSHLGSTRGKPRLNRAEFAELGLTGAFEGLVALSGCRRGEIPALILKGRFAEAKEVTERYIRVFGRDNFFLELSSVRLPGTSLLNRRLIELSRALRLKIIVTNNAHFALPEDFQVHDLLTCVRLGIRLDQIHPERRPNDENYLKSESEVRQVLKGQVPGDYERIIRETFELAQTCEPSLPDAEDLRPSFPTGGEPARDMLRRLVMEGAEQRYGRLRLGNADIRERLEYELDIISRLGFEDYFLLAWDIVRWAKAQKIRYSGRGSAADSAVAYCLFLSDVDPIARGLLFERFMSLERAEPPDIDLDFDARYRDDVTAYVYKKYGEDHAATIATYNTFRARSAVRELGKVTGFTPKELDRFAKSLPVGLPADAVKRALVAYPESRAFKNCTLEKDRAKWNILLDACEKVAGFPRFLGAHLGGVIITGAPVAHLSPLQVAAKGVNIVQFDKDDVETLGLAKLDLLSLRMLAAVEEVNSTIARRDPSFDYHRIPVEGNRPTYAMINRGETIGVFQLESPAQRALQARLGANRFEDIVASLALIRPGPIKGDMVEPFLKRRGGEEPVDYPDPRLQGILEKTYGVVLFQEQVIEIATVIAGFSPGEADRLRRVMTHGRSQQEMNAIGEVFVERAIKNGTKPEVARKIFEMIRGYASYGFCEAHAASFAVLASRSAYLAQYYPAEFYAGLISCQPMGYYPLHVLVGEARRRGVMVLGPSVNKSFGRCTVEDISESRSLEGQPGKDKSHKDCVNEKGQEKGHKEGHKQDHKRAIRLGLRLVKDMSSEVLERILEERSSEQRVYGEGLSRQETHERRICRQEVYSPEVLMQTLYGQGAHREGTCEQGVCEQGGGPFTSIRDFMLRVNPPRHIMENLILCGAFDELRPNARRMLLWEYANTRNASPDGAVDSAISHLDFFSRDFSLIEKIIWEYRILGTGVSGHLLSPFRDDLRRQGYRTTAEARHLPSGSKVKVAGLLVGPHRPPTKSGKTVVFMSLEDEFGIIDVTVFEKTYHRYGHLIFNPSSPVLGVSGKVDRRGNAVAIMTTAITTPVKIHTGTYA